MNLIDSVVAFFSTPWIDLFNPIALCANGQGNQGRVFRTKGFRKLQRAMLGFLCCKFDDRRMLRAELSNALFFFL